MKACPSSVEGEYLKQPQGCLGTTTYMHGLVKTLQNTKWGQGTPGSAKGQPGNKNAPIDCALLLTCIHRPAMRQHDVRLGLFPGYQNPLPYSAVAEPSTFVRGIVREAASCAPA